MARLSATESRKSLALAAFHGAFNVVGGLWPIVHMRSFERALGPKVDRWLVYTVAGLMMTIGAEQLRATIEPKGLRQARRIGIGCATTLGVIDVIYASRGRISRTYLIDAVMEGGWIIAWAATYKREARR